MSKIGRLFNKVKRYRACKKYYFQNGKRQKIVLLNTPTHGNLGDHAIAVAEKELLQKECPDYDLIDIDDGYGRINLPLWKKIIRKEDIICITGGGYLGDLWLNEEWYIQDILKNFVANKIIIFPQTIFFKEKQNLKQSQEAYLIHSKNLVMFLRDRRSYNYFRENYSFVERVYLAPDMVLSMSFSKKRRRDGVLFCLRQDVEKILPNRLIDIIKEFLEKKGELYTFTTTVCEERININERSARVKEKLFEFAGAKLVITDRLHGMLMAYVTGTPCIVFNNLSGKVAGVYEWIKDAGYIWFCDELSINEYLLLEALKKYESECQPSDFSRFYQEIVDVVHEKSVCK